MRLLSTAVLVLTGVTLLSCASVTNGSGQGSAPPTFGSTGGPGPTSTMPAPPTRTVGPTIVTLTRSPGPSPVPTPPVCAAGGCTKIKAVDIGIGYSVILYAGSSAGGSVGSSVLELTLEDVPVFWQITQDEIAGDLDCSPQPTPNCVMVAGVGAHASIARGYVREGDELMKYGEVPSDTPSTDPVDLNSDGLIDVVTAINTYEPSYATGTVYWQTFQSTGSAFASTGCTKPQHILPPEPSAPLTGTCPS